MLVSFLGMGVESLNKRPFFVSSFYLGIAIFWVFLKFPKSTFHVL